MDSNILRRLGFGKYNIAIPLAIMYFTKVASSYTVV